ncbi:unnamed protein product, partial [Onchocerca ochengi]|uniref:Uncharacterized protein n=1 Tax=Onchocerca ochengi TaxID=42157 RepID=A0A182EIQ9_ONCOC
MHARTHTQTHPRSHTQTYIHTCAYKRYLSRLTHNKVVALPSMQKLACMCVLVERVHV